jgi:hypothetical protein
MDVLAVGLRLVHVVLGVFWAGTLIFFATFLIPAIRDTGPQGGKVMAALQERGLMNVIPATAILTVLSGMWLYWRLSDGFTNAWMTTPYGIAMGSGGVLAIVGLAIGVGVMRPAALRVNALGRAMAANPDDPGNAAKGAEAQQLRQRIASAGKIVAILLALATAAMAVGRHL